MRSGRRGARAQADYVGYVIVFSAVLVATTVVVLYGTTALGQVQSATAADNGEFAMQSVASDLEAIHLGTARVRNTELTLQSASLETGPPAVLNVTAIYCDDSSDGDFEIEDPDGSTVEVDLDDPPDYGCSTGASVATEANYSYRPVVYSTGDADIVYANTLIIRDQQRGAVGLNDPLFSLGEDRAVIPAIQTDATSQSIGGGTRQIHSEFVSADGTAVTADPGIQFDYVAVNVTIQTTADWATVWERALNERLEGVPNPTNPSDPAPHCRARDDSTVSCYFRTDRLVVSNTTIEYEFR